MAIDKVKEYFKKFNIEDRIQEFEVSSATVLEAANALNCDPAHIAKTMAFKTEQPILIVTAGDMKIDNGKYKAKFKCKAHMLSPEELDESIGHNVGGVCPFGIKDNVSVYLDISLKRFQTVYPACGSDNSAIGLTTKELEKYSNYVEWIDVCKEKSY